MFPKKKDTANSKAGLKQSIDPRYHSFSVIEAFWQNLGSREEETYGIPYTHVLNWLAYWDQKVKVQNQ